jgi:acetoin utilization deacetylase AcuC-like enzyme
MQRRGNYDNDTFYNEHSPMAAQLAAGGIIQLLANILASDEVSDCENGFALVRPPGHHCEYERPMGFCLFNNAVVAVNSIIKQPRFRDSKILIVDWDVHHGNGTQDMFYNVGNVLYFSVHRYDQRTFYPRSGPLEEIGEELSATLL